MRGYVVADEEFIEVIDEWTPEYHRVYIGGRLVKSEQNDSVYIMPVVEIPCACCK
jgi:hypothetical protein